MGFSQDIDWSNEFTNHFERWENHGRNVLRSNCNHYEADEDNKNIEDENQKTSNVDYQDYCEECGCYEDNCEPMMNYIYPLELTDFDEDKILKVVKNTNCSVMENTETGEWFLVLCGGGMDLSQDIALSYVFLERWIPESLITQVCKQRGFSISKENFEILKKAIIEQSKHYKDSFKQLEKDWKEI